MQIVRFICKNVLKMQYFCVYRPNGGVMVQISYQIFVTCSYQSKPSLGQQDLQHHFSDNGLVTLTSRASVRF